VKLLVLTSLVERPLWGKINSLGESSRKILQMIKILVKTIFGIIIYDDHKYKRIKFFLNAYFDGLKGKFDNRRPKKILYEE